MTYIFQKGGIEKMKKKVMQKLGKRGLILIGVLFFVGLVCIATQSPAMAMGGALLPIVFGMATGVGSDSALNLRTLKYTHTAAVTAGDILAVNGWILMAVKTALISVENVYIYAGKVTFPKEASLAIASRAQVYWDTTNNCITTTVAGNVPCGWCQEAALTTDTTVVIILTPMASAVIGLRMMKIRSVVALSDAAATLTATQMIDGSIFTITPSAGRALTTATAAQLVTALPGAQVGTWFDFSIVCLAAFAATLTAGSNITLVGGVAPNNSSATFRAVFTNVTASLEAVTIYRIT